MMGLMMNPEPQSRGSQQLKGCEDMGKRARLKWPPRTRQPRRPIKTTQIDPLHGPALFDHEELRARIVLGKKF
jgi:hypothetical protein